MKFTHETFLRSVLSDYWIEHIFHSDCSDDTIGHALNGNYDLDERVGWNYVREFDTKMVVIGKV